MVHVHVSYIAISPTNAEACVKATGVLLNYLWRTMGRTELATGVVGNTVVSQQVRRAGSNNAAQEAIRVRESFVSYISAEGAMPWQPQV